MKKEILCQIKNLDILVIRLLFNSVKSKDLKPLTVTQTRIINYILNHKSEDVYQKDLEKELNLRRATVSEVLKTMEKKKIIRREKNPYDARSKKIILLEENDVKNRKMKNNIEKLEKILTKDISEEELLAFSLTLEKMQDNLNKQYNKQGGKNV